MHYHSRAAVLGITLITAALIRADDSPQPTLEQYKSEAGRFTVLLPGKPKESTKEIAKGKSTLHVCLVEVGMDIAYMVTYSDYPAETAKEAPQDVLKRARDAGVKSFGGEIKDDEEISLGEAKVPGRALRMLKNDSQYRARFYLSGVRLYQVVLLAPKGVASSQEADKYFDSFEITK